MSVQIPAGFPAEMNYLLEIIPAELAAEIYDFLGDTYTLLLERAAKRGRLGPTKILTRIGAPMGRSVRFAVLQNRMEVARFLVANGGEIDTKNYEECKRAKLPATTRWESLIKSR